MTAADLPEPIAAFKRAVEGPADPERDWWLVRVVRQDPDRHARLNRLTAGVGMGRVWQTLAQAPLHARYGTHSPALRSSLMVYSFLGHALCPPVPTEEPLADQNTRLGEIAQAARALQALLVARESSPALDVATCRFITVETTGFSTTQVLPGLDAALHALPLDAPLRQKLLPLQKESYWSHSARLDTVRDTLLDDERLRHLLTLPGESRLRHLAWPDYSPFFPGPALAATLFAPLLERLIPLAELADAAQQTPRPKPPHREPSARAIALVRVLGDFFREYYADPHYTAIASTVNAAFDLDRPGGSGGPRPFDGHRVRHLLRNPLKTQ